LKIKSYSFECSVVVVIASVVDDVSPVGGLIFGKTTLRGETALTQ
jgi:hypothetical protein